MEESRRMMNAGSKLSRRKSIDPTPQIPKPVRSFGSRSGAPLLDPSDFDDVFGGPPRSVLLSRYSGDFSASICGGIDDIFRPPTAAGERSKGRDLPLMFQMPAAHRRCEGFYDDIFGSGEDQRSRSRSKSNSSSVLSSEELSPHEHSAADDGFSSFASKLRPITIPSRQSSGSSTVSREQKRQNIAGAPLTGLHDFMCYSFSETTARKHPPLPKPRFGFSQLSSSPEAIALQPSSYRSFKEAADDQEMESPSSEISYGGQDPDLIRAGAEGGIMVEGEDSGDGDLLEESYVIEIAAKKREEIEEAVSVEEAIAWVRERSQARKSGDSKKASLVGIFMEDAALTEQRTKIDQGTLDMMELDVGPRGDFEKAIFLMAKFSEDFKIRDANEENELNDKVALELLDEIKNWSAGKEGNIRSLLSTLQYILWPGSGWHAIPLISMLEASQVKKAYQKARLCLHPDKLQQKGAKPTQKFMAEKVFGLLQDAWARFNSQGFFCG